MFTHSAYHNSKLLKLGSNHYTLLQYCSQFFHQNWHFLRTSNAQVGISWVRRFFVIDKGNSTISSWSYYYHIWFKNVHKTTACSAIEFKKSGLLVLSFQFLKIKSQCAELFAYYNSFLKRFSVEKRLSIDNYAQISKDLFMLFLLWRPE